MLLRVWLFCFLLLPGSLLASDTYSIATGSPSGLYYPFGGGLAQIWSRELDNVNIKAEVTGASAVNIIQVAKHESEVGISQGDALRDAISGKGIFPREMPVRVLFALYPNVVHAVTNASSSIKTLSDLRGKRVSIGAPGSGTAITTMNILNTLGITENDFDVQYLSYTETSDALKNGTIDAGFMVGGVGLAAAVELALTRDIRLIPISDIEMATISDAFPAYTAFEIPGETYKGVDEPVQTATLWNFLIVHQDMSDDEAYKLTKTAFDHMQEMMEVTRVARYTTPENTLRFSGGILHPGAQRYFDELDMTK
ncbi:MAG: TRAP transporter substrate-binding protein [Rickettsiales bacterium]|nr:TRAP transporter substrate-binding protein [Rickettsiales bacterium]